VVKIARDLITRKKVAMKIYTKHKLNTVKRIRNLKREISILKKTNHPNLIKLYTTIDTGK
jgi:serine/threonine protein kinase